jgi:hypothetical protein
MEQLQQYVKGEGLIQNIFPNLTPYERDWLKFGLTEQEWEEMYGEDGNAAGPHE